MIVEIANTFELHAEKGPAEGKRIPFSIRVCPIPVCKCQRLTIIIEQRLAIPGTGIQAAPRSELVMDFAHGNVASPEQKTPAMAQRIREFLEGATKTDCEALQKAWQVRKQSVIDDGPFSQVPDDWSQGLDLSSLVGFHEVFPLAEYVKFDSDGTEYWVEDCYCLVQGCECRQAILSFAPDPKDKSNSTLVSECAARVNLVDSTFHAEPQKDSEKVNRLIRQLSAQCPHLPQLLKQRYARVRQLVAEKPPPLPKPAVAMAEAKVGRNDPCPCGSGKKHKKCCGA